MRWTTSVHEAKLRVRERLADLLAFVWRLAVAELTMYVSWRVIAKGIGGVPGDMPMWMHLVALVAVLWQLERDTWRN